jgi:SAM-dependent methyltransferase
VACLICGGAALAPLFEKNGHRICRCRACGLTQLSPLPDVDIQTALYGDAYFEGAGGVGYADYAAQEEEYLATFADDLDRIADFVTSGSILDVGCGYGYFVRLALERGLDAWGVDVSEHAISVARQRLAGRVFSGMLGSIPEIDGRTFDVIYASHVVEHVPDPATFVRDLASRLTDRGVVVLVTPNVASWLARFSGRRWVSYKVPEHLAYYGPDTMKELLGRSGLEMIAIDPAQQYYRLPFLMSRIRELIRPLDRLVPPFEDLGALRKRMVRVTSGSMRVVARRGVRGER